MAHRQKVTFRKLVVEIDSGDEEITFEADPGKIESVDIEARIVPEFDVFDRHVREDNIRVTVVFTAPAASLGINFNEYFSHILDGPIQKLLYGGDEDGS